MNNTNDGATLRYKSKTIAWTNANDVASFKGGFIPQRGPNGGLVHIRSLTVHAILNMTIATAVGLGEDSYRFCRTIDLKTVGGTRRVENIGGDTARLISYGALGADMAYEHADLAVAATTDRRFSLTIPLSKPFAYDPDDTSLPSDFFDELRIGMASAAEFSLGTCVATIFSGFYYVVADCYESMSILLNAQDVWRTIDAGAVSQVDHEIDTGGRLQDLFLFVPGANGGQTLANLTAVAIQHSQPDPLLKDPDLKHAFQRDRGEQTNLFSTKGNPHTTSPFVSSDAGTLRALAVKLTTGNKVTDGVERLKETLRLTLSANLPAAARLVARFTVPKSEAQRAIIMRNHDVNMSYIKTRDKSRRDLSSWPEEMRKYLPEKFIKVDARGERIR